MLPCNAIRRVIRMLSLYTNGMGYFFDLVSVVSSIMKCIRFVDYLLSQYVLVCRRIDYIILAYYISIYYGSYGARGRPALTEAVLPIGLYLALPRVVLVCRPSSFFAAPIWFQCLFFPKRKS